MGLYLDLEKKTGGKASARALSGSTLYSDDSESSSSCSTPLKELSEVPPQIYYVDDDCCGDEGNAVKPALSSSQQRATSSNSDIWSRILAILPGFGSIYRTTEEKPLHPTAYLDGLRGVAAFIVFIHHFTLFSFLGGVDGFNSDNTSATRWLFQLPIIRLLYSGRPMVSIFFIISGFVLSYKPLQLIRRESYTLLFANLSSSVFRRPLRLFLPLVLPTFISAFLLQAGAWTSWANAAPNLHAQLWDWAKTLTQMLYPFHWDMAQPDYDDHLWTIPVEFRGSLVVFITLLGLGTTKPALRMAMVSLIAAMCFWKTRWECALFLAGVVLAEWTLIRAANDSPTLPICLSTPTLTWTFPRPSARSLLIIKTLNLVVALCFLSVTSLGGKETLVVRPVIYRLLQSGIPAQYERYDLIEWWYVVPASVLLLISFIALPVIQRPFTTRIVQYLGRISYSLYIVHGPIFRTFYEPVVNRAWKMIGAWDESFPRTVSLSRSPMQPPNSARVGFLAYIAGPMLGACILLPATMCTAHAFWRFVDRPSVSAARKVARWASMDS